MSEHAKRNRKLQICVWSAAFFGFLSASHNAMAQTQAPPTPECHIDIQQLPTDPSRTHILQPVVFKYAVTYDESCQLKVVPTAQLPMECTSPQIEIQPAQLITQFTANITVQCHFKRPGYYYSPPVKFEISQKNVQTLKTLHPNLQHITIAPYISADASITPVEATLNIRPWKQTGGYTWLFFFALIIGTLCGFSIYAKKSKKTQIVKEHIKPPTPIETLLAEIADLVNIFPNTTEEYKIYHDRLSNGLRKYLAVKMNIHVMNCTTRQLQKQLNEELPEDITQEIIRLLKESDVIKFTLDVPSQAANLTLLRDVGQLAEKLEKLFNEKEMMKKENESQNHSDNSSNSSSQPQN